MCRTAVSYFGQTGRWTDFTSLDYQNQICKFDNGVITYYTPTGDEIFADDWETKSDDVLAKWENI